MASYSSVPLGSPDRDRPSAETGNASSVAAGGVDLRLVHGVRQQPRAVGEVLQQVHVHVEGEQKGFVLFAQDLLEELAARLLLQGKHALLAARGVEQNAQRQRLVGLGHKALERLRHFVFQHRAVLLVQMRNQVALVVLDGEEQVHQVHSLLEGRHRRFIGRRSGSVAHRGRIGRGRKLAPSCSREDGQANQKGGNSNPGKHAGPLDENGALRKHSATD